jgi:hypothetical protein
MATFTASDDLAGAELRDVDLSGARLVGCDLTGVVMRGVQVDGTEIDAPWLFESRAGLRVNGVDVAPYVEAELNRRLPGRAERHAEDPEGLRSAWDSLQQAWSATLDRVAALPAGIVDESVDGEWSFAQTLRHLVLATDMWLGLAVLDLDRPFHPWGLPDASLREEGFDMTVFSGTEPSYAEVLEARESRVGMVRDYLATVTPDALVTRRKNPHDPAHEETTLGCLHVVLDEEWEHLRYAVRDLDVIVSRGGRLGPG